MDENERHQLGSQVFAILILFIMDLVSKDINVPFWAYLILLVSAIVWLVITDLITER